MTKVIKLSLPHVMDVMRFNGGTNCCIFVGHIVNIQVVFGLLFSSPLCLRLCSAWTKVSYRMK